MLLLAIPLYAAPFVLLSIMCCGVFLSFARLRRYALAALAAPVAFGACAAAGFISWVLVCGVLKIELGPMTGLRGVVEVMLVSILPGVLGSSAAIWIANKSVWAWGRLPLAPSWRERTLAAKAASSELI